MAKFVIAGSADCPFYAKAELLADELSLKLSEFKVHKIVKRPEEWEDWLRSTCEEKGWSHKGSPLIWRELVDRGGSGLLLGGCNEFLEMAQGYYGITSNKMSLKLINISKENLKTKEEIDAEEEERKKQINPVRVCVSGASSDLAYGMLGYLAQGEVFGIGQEVAITLLDHPDKLDNLKGVAYEVQDCAWPLLRGVEYTSEPEVAFKDVSVAVLLDGATIPKATDHQEYLLSNAKAFKQLGEVLEKQAAKDVKVLVGGGPANLNTFIASKFAPSIPKSNFCALSRIEENKAKGLLAKKLNVRTAGIKDVIIWGNPGVNYFPDASIARVDGYDGAIWGPHIPEFMRSVPEMVHDNKWLTGELVENTKISNDSVKGVMSGGAAINTQLQDWLNGSPSEIFSLGVISEGWYDVPQGIIFSFPVKFEQGGWKVVEGLSVSETLKTNILKIAKDIQEETTKIASQLT